MESRPEISTSVNDWHDFKHVLLSMWGKYGTQLLFVLCVILAVVLGYRVYHARERERHEAAWREMAAATSPESLKSLAQESADPAIRSLAYLRAGELLLAKATLPEKNVPAGTQPVQGEQSLDLERAALMFKESAAEQGASAVIRLNALLGLASVAESAMTYDEARKLYTQIVVEADKENLPAVAAQAKGRIIFLDRLKEPIVFRAEPAVPTPDTAAPPAGPDVHDASMIAPVEAPPAEIPIDLPSDKK